MLKVIIIVHETSLLVASGCGLDWVVWIKNLISFVMGWVGLC